MVCSNIFPYRLSAGYRKTAIFPLAPLTLETSRIFHDSRIHYPNIYGFVAQIVEIRCSYWSYGVF